MMHKDFEYFEIFGLVSINPLERAHIVFRKKNLDPKNKLTKLTKKK